MFCELLWAFHLERKADIRPSDNVAWRGKRSYSRFGYRFDSYPINCDLQTVISKMNNMINVRSLLTANAIVFLISGIMSIIAPSVILRMWGIAYDQGTLLTTQYDGVGSIAIALISWLARNAEDSKTQKAIILALLITYVIGVIVSVAGTVSGVMKTGWPVVVIFLFFATCFTYFRFFKRD